MKLALLQSRQNELYHFINTKKQWEAQECAVLQQEMLEQNFRMMEEAVSQGAELIVTTEAINFAGMPGQVKGDYRGLIAASQEEMGIRIADMAKKGNCWIVAGAYRIDRDGTMRNSALLWNPSGELQEAYDKIHLAGAEKEYLAAGDRHLLFDLPFGRVGVCICWDMQFPECARVLSILGADLIVCPTWGWEAVYGHARAYENGVYVAAAMAVPYWMDIEGIRSPSELVAPDGSVLRSAGRRDPGVLLCEADIRDCLPYRTLRMEDRRPDIYAF